MTDVLAPKAVYLATPAAHADAVEAVRRRLDVVSFEAGFTSQQVGCPPPAGVGLANLRRPLNPTFRQREHDHRKVQC